MEKAKKQYPSDEEIERVMAERKLNRIGAVQYLRRQSAKAIAQPKELNKVMAKLGDKAPHVAAATKSKAAGDGPKLKYDPAKVLGLWEKGKSISVIAEAMGPHLEGLCAPHPDHEVCETVRAGAKGTCRSPRKSEGRQGGG